MSTLDRPPHASAVPQAAAASLPAAQRALLFTLGVATFMVTLDSRVIAPLLPTIASDFGTSVARAGWLVSGYMLPYGVFQLAYGPLADRFGKVRVATYAMVAFSVGTAFCGAFIHFSSILLLRALTGAAAAALIPLTIAYIGDTVPYAQRQAALAMLMASSGAAQSFSTSLGGTIAELVSWRAVFPILGVLSGVVTLGLFRHRGQEVRVPRLENTPRPRYRDALRAPQMLPLLALVSTEGFLFMGGFPYLSGLLERRFGLSALPIGGILALAGVSQLAAARALPPLLRRVSERSLLAMGGGAMASAYLLSAVAWSWWYVATSCLLIGAGFSLCHSTLQTRASEAFARGRGTALSLFAFSLFSGSALGSVCVGYASEWLGYGRTFGAAGVLLLAFTGIVVRVLGRRQTVP